MESIICVVARISGAVPSAAVHHYYLPCGLSHPGVSLPDHFLSKRPLSGGRLKLVDRVGYPSRLAAVPSTAAGINNSTPRKEGNYSVGDFMTKKEHLHVVEPTTTVEKALETLVEKRITGFPVIDADWNLVGVVSDYDLLALDSISGGNHADTNLFPDVDSSWKTFNEIQRLLGKNDGKVVGDLMTPAPLVVRETTNLEDAVRLLLETKYRRLPVVDGDGKLVGILTRGDVVRGALQIKRAIEKMQ